MKSEWKVTSQYVGEEKIYQVYRLRDINAVDHSGNREYVPHFVTNDKKEAEAMAIAKNKETDDAEKDT